MTNNEEMSEDEKKFKKKINIDKAIKKANLAIGVIVISILTYVFPLIAGEFDFGIIFEVVSLIALLKAKSYMKKQDENQIKKYTIGAIFAIGWILIYDFICWFLSFENIVAIIIYAPDFFYVEVFIIIYLLILFAILRDVAKAENPIKYKESTDWFYEKYEDKGKNKNV